MAKQQVYIWLIDVFKGRIKLFFFFQLTTNEVSAQALIYITKTHPCNIQLFSRP